jgi:hypothetical protein
VFSYILQSFLQYAKKRERILFRQALHVGMGFKADGNIISIGKQPAFCSHGRHHAKVANNRRMQSMRYVTNIIVNEAQFLKRSVNGGQLSRLRQSNF